MIYSGSIIVLGRSSGSDRVDTATSKRCQPKIHMSPALQRVLGHVDFGKMFRSLASDQWTEEPISVYTLRDEIATLKQKLREEQEIGLNLQVLFYNFRHGVLEQQIPQV